MYEQRFGLKRRPFPPAPDASLYYPATLHEAALNALQRALVDDEGLLLVTGVPGTGKTLLGYTLLERVRQDYDSVFLTNAWLADRLSLLQAILYDLGLPFETGGEQVLRLRLMDHLLTTCAAGRRTLVIVDEAHYLGPDLLEELRLLGNLEAGAGKAVQVVLLAQPTLAAVLQRPELTALRQRLAVRVELSPLGLEEACDYILHHLRQAGGDPQKVIDEAAVEALARGAQGIPRLLNQATHQALLLADSGDLPLVDTEAALEALSVLGLGDGADETPASEDSSLRVGPARRTA
jgi:general secretion pathway protein A